MPFPQPKAQKRIQIPLTYGGLYSAFGQQYHAGGMYSAGDSGSIPRMDLRSLSNILPQPNRLQVRPPFVYDSLMAINGLANFDDQTNKVTRLCSIDATQHLYEKGTSGETWSAANATTISGTRLTDFANYRGKLYAMVDDGAGLPSAAFSFDGTNITTSPFNSTIQARTVTAFNDRLFLGYPRVTVTNKAASNHADAAYDWSTRWTKTSCTARIITAGATKTCRVYPTATTGALAYDSDSTGILVATTQYPFVYRQDMRNTSSSYAMPFTLEIIIGSANTSFWQSAHAYATDNVIVDSNNNFQRCTTAGTSGGGAPAWATTVGSTTADGAGALVWTCEGPNIIATYEGTLPASSTPAWYTFSCSGVSPFSTSNLDYPTARFKFGNTTTSTITLTPIDVSYRDGNADGAVNKQNYGSQLTAGDFIYPFQNTEASSNATIDMQQIVWSEIGSPQQIRASNTYNPWESPGYITAATTISGRYIVFKRNAFWVFQGTSDPDNPIQRESYDDSVGCLGPRAIVSMEDVAYCIGENEIYAYTVGSAPVPLCGDGTREEILNKGANWVESQSTYKRPLLALDKSKLLLWVYTQKATLYCYDIRNQKWSKHLTPNSAEVDAMQYNPNTGEVYVAFASGTYGLSRLDFTASQNDTIDNTANTYAVTADVIFRPIELYEPPRFDATLEDVRFFHAATASQSGQTVSCYYSTDQGNTFGHSETITLSPLSINGEYIPVRMNALQTAPSVTVKLTHTGKGGATNWTISERAYGTVNVRRGEYQQANQTGASGNLVNA